MEQKKRRPGWRTYFMNIAEEVASRHTCDRLAVGAVIVDSSNTIRATGYNGAPKGEPHCIEVGCDLRPRGPSGRLSCHRPIHAEINALRHLKNAYIRDRGFVWFLLHTLLDTIGWDYRYAEGHTVYVTHQPCPDCMGEIAQSGVTRLFYRYVYSGATNDATAKAYGVIVTRLLED